MTITQIEKNTPTVLQIKIMYWGPGEAGKTTNYLRLQEIFSRYKISKGFSIATTDHRTLWNDSVHFRFYLGQFNIELIVNVATTTGQERFLATREYILQNADGVIFVGDSQPEKLENNIRSFEEVVSLTRTNRIPILIQLNKRDLAEAISEKEFREALKLPQIEKDAQGFQVVYLGTANDLSRNSGVKQIFLDLIQKILQQKLMFSE